jgi:hypothetical protein
MIKSNFWIIFLIFSIQACVIRTDVELSESRHYPKQPAFTIKPNDGFENSTLNFDAIYYSTHQTVVKNKVRVSYNWHRFWPNGRTLIDYSDHLPSNKEVEDFTQAYIGYYRIDNDTELTMEYFVPDTGKMQWNYLKVFGKVKGDNIIIYREVMNDQTREYRDVLKEYGFENLRRQPDW